MQAWIRKVFYMWAGNNGIGFSKEEYFHFMKLSICCITYNQAEFIRQSLDSFLEQRTDFSFEIVVGDDASTDSTPEILKEYAEKHPQLIRLLLRKENIGMVANFVDTIKSCKGQYIALCEGDDYWIYNGKLQQQVEYLDSHPEFSICFHKARIEFSGVTPYEFPDINRDTPGRTGFSDLIKGNFIHTPTCVFRNGQFGQYPEAFLTLGMGDWPLHLLNTLSGDAGFFDQEWAVYRVSAKGLWSLKKEIQRFEQSVAAYDVFLKVFGERHKKEVSRARAGYARYLLKLYWRDRKYSKLLQNGLQFLKMSLH